MVVRGIQGEKGVYIEVGDIQILGILYLDLVIQVQVCSGGGG